MAQFICDKTKDEILAIDDMITLSLILNDNDINYDALETVEEMRDLILQHLHERDHAESLSSLNCDDTAGCSRARKEAHSSSQILEKILMNDAQKKAELGAIYSMLERFFEHKNFCDELKGEMTTEFGDFVSLIQHYKEELEREECPIVVAGETGAGKSSLLNLLLGATILPHSVLCTTATICRIRYSEEKHVVVTMLDGEKRKLQYTDEETMKQELQQYAGISANRKDNPYEVVDIYWPLPVLKNNAMIVDTMGIGESEVMTEKLMEYLPKAVAFIYVINSSNAGGVQSDRLLKIFSKQMEWEKEGKMQTFDPSCTLFICNKWDQVPQEEEEKVWEDTAKKLQTSWPSNKDFNIKSCMFKMCTLEETRRAVSGLRYTEKFKKLLEGIERLVPASLEARVRRHADWMEKFLKRLLHRVIAHINATKKNEEEKQKMKSDVEDRIKKLRHNTQEVSTRLQEKAKEKCRDIAIQLVQYLKDKATRAAMFKWIPGDLPTGNDMEVIKYNACQIIAGRINNKVMEWCLSQNISQVTTELFDLFKSEFRLIEGGCKEIDDIMEGISPPLDGYIATDDKPSETVRMAPSLFNTQEKVALVLSAPLWIPLVIGAAILALPVSIGMVIKDTITEKQKLSRYKANKEEYMMHKAEQILREFNEDLIYQRLEATYLASFNSHLKELCEVVIPKQIEADEQLVCNIMNDMRGSEDIKKQYQPLERHCKQILGQLMVVMMEHFSGCLIQGEDIQKGELLGNGSYSEVHEGKVKLHGQEVSCAIKTMKGALEKERAYTQLTEVKNLGKFHHENIIQFYGISFIKDRSNHRYLQIVMELCDDTLDSMMRCSDTQSSSSREPYTKRSCHLYNDRKSPEFISAWRFYADMLLGIVRGLVYLHRGGYVHRDLKLTNILVKGNVAKIADVGFSAEEDMLTGTIIGSPTNMSPEVLQGKLYGIEADIYSLSIVMWEMWYNCRVYSEEMYMEYMSSYYNLKELVQSGSRPMLDKKFAPPVQLKVLISDCWKENPKERPTIYNVLERVIKIDKDFRNGRKS